jgi:hypothetical protein
MRQVEFMIAGIPAPQGSKTRTKWGVREDNPATKPWRSAVAWEATAAMMRRPPARRAARADRAVLLPQPEVALPHRETCGSTARDRTGLLRYEARRRQAAARDR